MEDRRRPRRHWPYLSVVALFGVGCGASDLSGTVVPGDAAADGGPGSSGKGGRADGAGGSVGAGSGGRGGKAGAGGAGGAGGATASSDAAIADASSDQRSPDGAGATCSVDASTCLGVCASTPPICMAGVARCVGPGQEAVETSCDGFDNDCDGLVDEGCPTCVVDVARITANLGSIWDIDFDAQCNAYLTTLVSGPDHTTVVPADAQQPVASYTGNANQNMVYGFVDPNPTSHRVVVTYSCCSTCGCLAKNGLTLLYTCDPEGGCGCAGQTNCPGFLDAPFLPTAVADTSALLDGKPIASPTGLAAGPGSTYFVGNFAPATCSTDSDCVPCDASHPSLWCSPSRAACCATTGPLGRVAQFEPPTATVEARFREVAVLTGEQVLGLAPSGDGSVVVGTYATASIGNLHRIAPNGTVTPIATLSGPAYSVTEDRRTGDLYVEILGTPKIQRLSATGGTLPLPTDVPANPAGDGILQYGPDGRLYRLVGVVNGTSTLTVHSLQ